MMVLLLGQQRDARHEGEGFGKIRKEELARDRISGVVEIPLAQRVESGRPLGLGQLFDHPFASQRVSRYLAAMGTKGQLAPSCEDIETLARAAIERLPEHFRTHLGDVVLIVEDFASEEILDEMEIEDPFDLTGLYSGRSIASERQTGEMPAMIQLFRRPILDEWAGGGETLEHLVAHVLIHEVGHHFGLSDADMHALEAAAA